MAALPRVTLRSWKSPKPPCQLSPAHPCRCLWEEQTVPTWSGAALPSQHSGLLLTPSLSGAGGPLPSLRPSGVEVLVGCHSHSPLRRSQLRPVSTIFHPKPGSWRRWCWRPGWGSAPSGVGPGRVRQFGAGGDHLNLEGSSHRGSGAPFGYQGRRGRHGPGAMTWPGLLGHCLTFFVPRARVWYQEKNLVARDGGVAGEGFRAVLTHGWGPGLPGELGGR